MEVNNYYNNSALSNQSKDQQLSKIKIGLPTIGQTYSFNCAIQQLRQFYHIDRTIFASSSSKCVQYLNDLFNHLEIGNNLYSSKIMKQILDLVQKQQNYQEGDPYICIYNFLNLIQKELLKNEKEEFDNNFLLKYSDQLECQNCKNKIQNTRALCTYYQYEEFGQECNSLSLAFSLQADQSIFQQNNSDIICDKCLQNIFFTKREYQNAPNFMMIRILNHNQQGQNDNNFIEQQFKLYIKGQNSPYKYQIIGFCNYYSSYPQYIAKYDDQWIQFNYSQAQSVSQINCSNALYFVLKKIQDNTDESEKKYSYLQSQNSSFLKQINNNQDRQLNQKFEESNRNNQEKSDICYSQKQQEHLNYSQDKNKQDCSLNENCQKKIDETIQRFKNSCDMLPYLGDKQYMIPVIQTLIQIHYFFDEDIYGPKNSKNQEFKTLILFLEQQETQNSKKLFKSTFMNIKQNKKYQKSQEAYSYFCDLLFEVVYTLNPSQESKFESNFFFKYTDQFQCKNCKITIKAEQISSFQQQEICYQMLNDDNLSKFKDYSTNYLFKQCKECQLQNLSQKRLYIETPNFIIINQNSHKLNQQLSKKINNLFKLNLNDGHNQNYQIIGFCSYSNQEYYYTAKCGDYWVEKNKQINQLPDCTYAQYFVLQKQIQN